MIPDIEESERYCALIAYELTANCEGALLGEWIGEDSNGNSLGIVFSSPFNSTTFVTVPKEDTYSFQFRCCK